jgi:hypothetical protein
MISLSVNVFFSARWRCATAGISAVANAGQTTAASATRAHRRDAAGIGSPAQGVIGHARRAQVPLPARKT